MSKKLIIIMVLIFALSVSLDCQTDKKPAEKPKTKVNSWSMPAHMLESLQYMQRLYELEFNRKVESFIEILTTRYKEYEKMPAENVIFDFSKGVFFQRDQFQKAQAENQRAIQDAIDAEKAKEKKEAKNPEFDINEWLGVDGILEYERMPVEKAKEKKEIK